MHKSVNQVALGYIYAQIAKSELELNKIYIALDHINKAITIFWSISSHINTCFIVILLHCNHFLLMPLTVGVLQFFMLYLNFWGCKFLYPLENSRSPCWIIWHDIFNSLKVGTKSSVRLPRWNWWAAFSLNLGWYTRRLNASYIQDILCDTDTVSLVKSPPYITEYNFLGRKVYLWDINDMMHTCSKSSYCVQAVIIWVGNEAHT